MSSRSKATSNRNLANSTLPVYSLENTLRAELDLHLGKKIWENHKFLFFRDVNYEAKVYQKVFPTAE